jgi:translation initiation factor 3 subunit A
MSSSIYVLKPESALRRAEELLSIQQPDSALALLHEVLSSRRSRTWSPIYEKIMMAYIDLCLSLNRAREAKDGLHQYRNLAQSQAPGSLEIVIKYIIDEAEKKCREAKDQVADTHAAAGAEDLGDDDDEDGDAVGTPNIVASSSNILLLSTMTTDPEQNQRDSALLLPRIKFLWEAYRAVLDILKSNSKLEKLYHITAIGALQFCSTYKRRTEFKRLCDLLRNHLQTLQKYGSFTATNKVDDQSKLNNKVRGWEVGDDRHESTLIPNFHSISLYFILLYLGLDQRIDRTSFANPIRAVRNSFYSPLVYGGIQDCGRYL